jgi:hypothetical protein
MDIIVMSPKATSITRLKTTRFSSILMNLGLLSRIKEIKLVKKVSPAAAIPSSRRAS